MTQGPILAFDTSAAHCAAALLDADGVLLARQGEAMARGQAERLMPLLEALLARSGLGWRDLGALAVGVGPGNFTGIRIAVSAARGLALGLGIPAHGISGFDALTLDRPDHAAVLPAPRGQVWLRRPGQAPELAATAPREVALAEMGDPAELAEAIARVALARPLPDAPPAPLYLRPADAAPARDAPPVLLD